jgi:hypothetical protein
MKLHSKIALAAVVSTALASSAFAASPGVLGTPTVRPDPGTIANLQDAADKALADGRNGNKNNLAFLRKNYEIERLIAKRQEGKPVDEAQIDQALQPVHVW